MNKVNHIKTNESIEKVYEELNKLFYEVDNAFSRVAEQYPSLVHCRSGCNDCCFALFDISFIEACNLANVFRGLPRNERRKAIHLAEKFLKTWESLGPNPSIEDLSNARVRCPLLGEDGLCLCYEARPVNCRTYGVPTSIEGKGHVCGLSGFKAGNTYPTINLTNLQIHLFQLSKAASFDPEDASRRFTIAQVILGS